MTKHSGVGNILRFNITIPLWLVVTIGVIIIAVGYIAIPAQRSLIQFLSVLVAGAAAIYSAYYVGAALRLNLEREKQKASFEILSLLNRPEFVEVRRFLETQVEGHAKVSAEELYNKISADVKLDHSVTIVLGILEDMSIAIQSDYVNENTLYMSVFDIVRRHFHSLRGYIEQMRKVRSQPDFFIELEKLCNSWESCKRLSDGKRLPILGK